MSKDTKPNKADKSDAPRRGSGSSHVYNVLRNEIIDLALAPGSPMDELQLADRFSLSRTPIREALVRLSVEGLITTLPNRATIVSNIDFLHLPQFFDALTLMYRVTTRLAAGHHHPDDIARMRTKQAAFTQAVDARDALALIATNCDFHLEIARAGGNSYYTDLFARLLDQNRRLLRLYYSSFNDELPRKYVTEHDQMIEAIEARDVDAADRLASAHAQQIVTQIQSYITADKRINARISL
ncbi:GntR family transcriptional regulator [Pelagibacterium sp.]|uniref:GntR family transcriptional regulator n=1 Tax=Pelagibacterium sp. TaxID=1967288 RepID=UPI003A94BCDD